MLGRFSARALEAWRDAGVLLLRVGAGGLIWSFHMRPKLQHFDDELLHFPDPLGVGHAISFALALASEGACAVLVAVGLATRLACLPIVFTMAMVLVLALRGFEGADVQAALLYALPYLALVLLGPGRWSVDARLAPLYARLLERFVHTRPAR